MTCLLALTDNVLRENEGFSASDFQAQANQAKLLIWFLNRPGLPLSVVAGAMERITPPMPMFLLSDSPDTPEGSPQTVDAVITRSDGPSTLLSMLQSVSGAEPCQIVPDSSCLIPNIRFDCDRLRILDDLKSLLDSFRPEAKQYLISEVRVALTDLAKLEQKL